ncbi:hypothetical protein IGS68_03175 [Skermanella sp. TT6]|uniref:Potassium channel domain-containing protein n=1 Tax=Skermanella cutis TaxID=2775420 RepID=A0ABX7B7E0_9PROT|nr:potassium channel family protein [Skermanella sp. TT6]QQP90276.1 hypothetical protein IGS68_03175 [Skermanella sp. TT6]
MSLVFAVAGLAVIALALSDIFVTSLTLRGAGPVTRRLTSTLWRIARAFFLKNRGLRSSLALVGPLIAAATVINWLLLLWIGWTLVFVAGTGNVLIDSTDEPADWLGKAYFVGYTLSTLGLGDIRPDGPGWRLATALASINGFLTVSLAATYLLPVVMAAARQRQLAVYIHGLGDTPADVVLSGWDGKGFTALEQHLAALAPMVMEVGHQHLVYPVLYAFHNTRREAAFDMKIAVLDEALHLLHFGVAPDVRPVTAATRPLEVGITSLLERMRDAAIEATSEPPVLPDLERLRRHGIPVVGMDEFRRSMGTRAPRRCQMQAVVLDAGWSWDDVGPERERDARR